MVEQKKKRKKIKKKKIKGKKRKKAKERVAALAKPVVRCGPRKTLGESCPGKTPDCRFA